MNVLSVAINLEVRRLVIFIFVVLSLTITHFDRTKSFSDTVELDFNEGLIKIIYLALDNNIATYIPTHSAFLFPILQLPYSAGTTKV